MPWYNHTMAGKNERTHKHRNIIDDILDLGLTVGMIAWYFVGIELDHETLAMIGAAGASARVTLRRILMGMWGEKLGIEAEPETEAEDEPKPDDGDSDAAESGDGDDSGEDNS